MFAGPRSSFWSSFRAYSIHRGPGLWDEVCSPKMQWWSLLALADLYVINRPHTAPFACLCCAYSVLCVPLLCIPVLRAFVLGVWCACAAFV